MLNNILKHAHSGLRWVALFLLIAAIATAWQTMKSGRQAGKLPLFALITAHVQLLLGLVLYFTSPHVQFVEGFMKDTVLRFYSVEHITIMLLAIAAITVGYSRAKRQTSEAGKAKVIFRFYTIALVLILLGIPWPFRIPVAGWF